MLMVIEDPREISALRDITPIWARFKGAYYRVPSDTFYVSSIKSFGKYLQKVPKIQYSCTKNTGITLLLLKDNLEKMPYEH